MYCKQLLCMYVCGSTYIVSLGCCKEIQRQMISCSYSVTVEYTLAELTSFTTGV